MTISKGGTVMMIELLLSFIPGIIVTLTAITGGLITTKYLQRRDEKMEK